MNRLLIVCCADAIILAILSLLIAAAIFYLPNHIAIVSNRLWYYVHGEFLDSTATATTLTGNFEAAIGRDEMTRTVTEAVQKASGSLAEAVTAARREL